MNHVADVQDLSKPYRPLPIAALNRVGVALRTLGVGKAPLLADELIAEARKRTGLSSFGDEGFREPLERLLDSISNEAQLTPIGRMITRGRLVGLLSNKLYVQAAIEKHPEIVEAPVQAPLVIAGLQRTGTTMLHRLIAQDPGIRSLPSWEALNPVPRPGRRDRRVQHAVMAEKGLAYMAPAFFAIHPVESTAPEEEVILLDQSFLSTAPEATMYVPSYAAWLENQDQRPAYRELKRMLQYLQWLRPAERWVLKTPHHLEWLDVLLDVFPDAKIIQTHRDPLKTLASFCSMVTHARGVFSDAVDPADVGAHWLRKTVRMVTRAMEVRDRAPASFADVSYYDLIQEPIPAVARIYTAVGREMTAEARQAMQQSRKRNVQHKHGRHNYRLEDFGLSRERVDVAYKPYRARFNIRYE